MIYNKTELLNVHSVNYKNGMSSRVPTSVRLKEQRDAALRAQMVADSLLQKDVSEGCLFDMIEERK